MSMNFQEAQLELFLVPPHFSQQNAVMIPDPGFPHPHTKVVVIRVDTAGREAQLSSQEGI